MLPFVSNDFASYFGMYTPVTNFWRYMRYSKFTPDKKRMHGSSLDNTIFWNRIPFHIYYKKWFIEMLKKIMMLINVWFFFIRMNCMPQCVLNLLDFMNPKWNPLNSQPLSLKNQRLGVELMLICYISALQFVPGGHFQFMMWYEELIPLFVEMIGLPPVLTFKFYHDVFPCDLSQPTIHHAFGLMMSAWLLIFGANVFERISKHE